MMDNVKITQDEMNSVLQRARYERSKYMADMTKSACSRIHRACTQPDAEHRKLAKAAIAPLTAGHRHNRSSVNPLMVRGLAIS
ncbi:MAG: hypothetical protein AAF495_09895 [Pseudomonadota bacterium]